MLPRRRGWRAVRPALMRTLLLPLLLGLIAGAPARAQDNLDVQAASRSVVRVVVVGLEGGSPSGIGTGSGVAVAPDRILTNAHVLAEAAEGTAIIGIVPSEGRQRFTGRLIAIDTRRDLALIQLTEGRVEPATIATGAVPDGAAVAAVGYPYSVDRARELSAEGFVTPQAPVKSWGRVSSGASSQRFDTVLHDASIGRGNSGGPLVDSCGRVVGINSFVSNSEGIDAVFGFAVSARELVPFLREAGVKPRTTAIACRSATEQAALDDQLAREEAERAAAERDRADTAEDRDEARRQTIRDRIAAEREARIGVAMLALAFATFGANAALMLAMRRDRRLALATLAGTGLMLAGGAIAWGTRPDFDEVDARLAAERRAAAPPARAAAMPGGTGPRQCRLDLARSRVTISDPADFALDWSGTGCADGRSQFAEVEGTWLRADLPAGQAAADISSFDPATGQYRIERYLLSADQAAAARALAARYPARACSPETVGMVATLATAIRDVLPPAPNERLLYRCDPQQGAGPAKPPTGR
ncbi:S1C family serine protease [Sphingomonas changnyeongensis]|nr:serine protease [Sphingomonas changnyeongensis]